MKLAVTYSIVYVVGGVILFIATLLERKRLRSRWARGMLFTAAGLVFVLGAVKLSLYAALWTPSPALHRSLPHRFGFIAGVVLGIFLALGFSGELVGRKRSESSKRG